MKRSDLPIVILDLGRARDLIGHPCHICPGDCTIGAHVYDSTRNMAPGLKAQTTEPRVRSWTNDTDDSPDRHDDTTTLHTDYVTALQDLQRAARTVADMISRLRPDRHVPVAHLTAGDDNWCTNHLRYAGICEPRSEGRGTLCRWCYDIRTEHNTLPDARLIREHAARRLTPNQLEDFRTRTRTQRRKAGSGRVA